MSILKILGAIFVICFIYSLLKEIGIFELLGTILSIFLTAAAVALGISFVISLFGPAFEAVLKVVFPVCIIYVIFKMIKK